MRLIHTTETGVIEDLTQLVTTVTWSGDKTQVARKLEFGVLVSSSDQLLPRVNVQTGDRITFYGEKGLELFRGVVFSREKSHSNNEMKFTCYDMGIYLTKNEGNYNFKNTTAEAITKKVCSDFGIPIGHIASTGVKQSRINMGEPLYDIIMKGYSKAFETTKKPYFLIMKSGKLNVYEKGSIVSGYVLENSLNLFDSTYSESIENMVNKVVIIDKDGNNNGSVNNAEWVKKFGTFTKVYKKDENDNNPKATANSMLEGMEQKASVSAIGNEECVSGYAVIVHDPYVELYGKFYIDGDTHTWSNGQYSMQLTLEFKNIMDLKDVKEQTDGGSKGEETGATGMTDVKTVNDMPTADLPIGVDGKPDRPKNAKSPIIVKQFENNSITAPYSALPVPPKKKYVFPKFNVK